MNQWEIVGNCSLCGAPILFPRGWSQSPEKPDCTYTCLCFVVRDAEVRVPKL